MFSPAFFAPVVGANFPTARAPSRLKAIAECRPGDELQLRRERQPIGGRRAVGVYTADGDQLGYIHPPQADEVASVVAVARAVFQRPDTFGAVIRVTLDGTTPTLPAPAPRRQRTGPPAEPVDQFCDIFPNGPEGKNQWADGSIPALPGISTNPASLRGSVREQNV